jgi:chemosensory pili system protein ChpA (sensor histidine kinase/response regulator)
MSEVSSQILHVVARELAAELNDARAALEEFGERQDDVTQLIRCGEHLHVVHGALRVVEVYGAALLAEEMEQAVRYLVDTFAEKRHLAEGLDALMRAMVQLPTYLERVLGGGRDMALVLLPLLNDLRAVRGSPLLSEGTLLLLNLTSDQQPSPAPPAAGEAATTVVHWARKLRPRFQVGLLGWIKGERPEQNLEVLARTAEKLEQAATTQPVFQLWWVVGALLESLRAKGQEESASVKRLLGQADREMRRLYQVGEASYSESPPIELLNNLLYYVARAKSTGPRVSAVRASFRLGELLPVDDRVAQARDSLSAPSVRLMKTVAAAIKEDLARVKDSLDIFVRKGATQVEELGTQLEMLKKIGDTLGVLGLGELRDRVQSEIAGLQAIVAQNTPLDDNSLLKIAATLIGIEDGLDEQLIGLIVPATGDAAASQAGATGDDTEFRHVTEAVLRECIVNLARIKEAIAMNVERPQDAQPLDQIPQLIHGITAGLLMLGKTRAVEVTEGIAAALAQSLKSGGPRIATERLDRLADAIVSVEYYMETLQAGRTDPWYMLDNAENCLKAMAAAPQLDKPLPPMPTPADYARTVAIEPPPGAIDALADDLEVTTVFDPAATTPAVTRTLVQSKPAPGLPAVLAPSEDKVDPEFLELFIEEAKDEITKLNALFPRWDENPADQEALVNVRRSFHTLKGSGRMVGAQLIGEVAWSIESLLNRVINKTLARTPEMMALLRSAVAAVPELVEQLETGRDPQVDVARLIAEAKSISGVQEPTSAPRVQPPLRAQPVAPVAEIPPVPPAPPAAEMDPVLHDIFAKETAAHLATIRNYLVTAHQAAPPHPVTEALHRACHTLSGIAKTAGARQGIKIAEPLNHYIRKLYDGGLGLSQAGLIVLGDAVAAIENVVDHISENTGFFSTHASIIARLEELERAADLDLSARTEVPAMTMRMQVPAFASEPAAPASDTSDSAILRLLQSEAAASAPEPAIADASDEFLLLDSEDSSGLDFLLQEEPEARAEAVLGTDMALAPGDERTTLDFDLGAEPTAIVPHAAEAAAPAEETGEGTIIVEEDVFVEDVTLSLELEPVQALPEPAEAVPTAVVPAALAPEDLGPDEDFDADVAAIFTEEATELLEAADTALAGWSQDQADGANIFEFKRALHTLKGGARMAGIRAMGDLSHEVESFMLAVENRTVRADQNVFSTMRASLDELHHMRDAVAQGKRVRHARDLIERIRSLTSGARFDADMDAELQEAQKPAEVLPPPVERPAPIAEVPQSLAASIPPAVQAPSIQPWTPSRARPEILVPAEAEPEDEAQASGGEQEFQPLALPPGREPQVQERHEVARVDADLLDTLLNNAGEVSIFRSRLEQQVGSIEFNLAELSRTVTRLKDQLRKLEMETEAQVLHRHQQETGGRADFDPLELDRYSTIQQLSRALAESVSDVGSIEGLLETLTREGQNLLMQQARVVTELQSGLMRTRMVPFQRHEQRLSRLVRQVAADTGKHAELVVTGASGELDRQVLERMLPPFEHMLRNAVVHGIETPEERAAAGKPEMGTIKVSLAREGAEIVIVIEDDGRGIDVQAVRERARSRGLLQPGRVLTDEEALQLILEPGFSTASSVTQHAGRGVGMDVVVTEIKKLGGALFTQSTHGKGTRFTVRLPFTLAISQALVVRVTDELYALPLPTVEGVSRVSREEVLRHLAEPEPTYSYGGQVYRFQYLGSFLGAGPAVLPETDAPLPVILIRAGEHSTALVTDELVGSREIVVKSVGPQIASIRGISGATILGDGRIVIILDMGALVRSEWRSRAAVPQRTTEDRRTFVLVVDDSITVRRVTQRLLERNGMRVMTAKDGVDALAVLQEHLPDIILLDIEMPRMDGYELAQHVRADERTATIPIVMITSRVGEKHRARAIELGVNDYLGKPYQESQLLDAIDPLVEAHRRKQA